LRIPGADVETTMMTLLNTLAALTFERFVFFHGGRGEGFGALLVVLVLVAVVFWVLMRSGNRETA
jgi:hypothetical protein